MKILIFQFVIGFILSLTIAQKINGQNNDSDNVMIKDSVTETKPGMDFFVHPFLSHMALADSPGEVSFRLNGMQVRNAENLTTDFGYHIEAGIVKNLGIHLRSDGIKTNQFSEIMLMYNVLTDKSGDNGVSVFGQLSIPTGSIQANTYKKFLGIGARTTLYPLLVFNGDVHYNFKDKTAEYEGSLVFKATDLIFPILEARGELTEENTSLYLLPAINFRIQKNQTIGLGFQIAVSEVREYDVQSLIQYGIEF